MSGFSLQDVKLSISALNKVLRLSHRYVRYMDYAPSSIDALRTLRRIVPAHADVCDTRVSITDS